MAPSLRLIQDAVSAGDGTPVSGSIEIAWETGVTPDGFTLAKGKISVPVTNGALSVQLAPGTYRATYHIGTAYHVETWVVPTTAGPFTIAQIKT